jgi:hypothetical protein
MRGDERAREDWPPRSPGAQAGQGGSVPPGAPALAGRSERWRKVPGWPYEAAYWGGHVRRLGNSRPLADVINRDGYADITLYRRRLDGTRERKKFGVHQVVALAWLGRPEVLHGRGGQQDNSVPNLRYGSRRQNELDKSPAGSIPGRRTGMDEGTNEKEKGQKDINRQRVAHPAGPVAPIAGDVQR